MVALKEDSSNKALSSKNSSIPAGWQMHTVAIQSLATLLGMMTFVYSPCNAMVQSSILSQTETLLWRTLEQ